MKKFYKIGFFFSFIAVAALIFGGCATIFKGSTEDVSFFSAPTGAEVYVNGSLLGTTPVTLKLQSKNSYVIEFKKEGYETKTVLINNSIGITWIILDVLGGVGLIPIAIDAYTGSWYSLDPKNVNVVLEKQKK